MSLYGIQWHTLGIYINVALKDYVESILHGHAEYYGSVHTSLYGIQWHMLGIYFNVAVKHDVKRVVCGHVEYYASVLWSCRVVCCCMVLEYGDMPPRNNASI